MEGVLAGYDSSKIGKPGCLGDAGLRLKGYQLVGLNWLRVLHDTDVNGILAGIILSAVRRILLSSIKCFWCCGGWVFMREGDHSSITSTV